MSEDFVTPGKKYDVDGSDCPQGLACSIHYRNDEFVMNDEVEAGRLISYVGNYVVVTEDNQELNNPAIAIRALLDPNFVMPPLYETSVTEVGEGALGDLYERAGNNAKLIHEMTRFVQTHDTWSKFQDSHDMVISLLKEGMLDLSKPYYESK